MTDTTNTPSLDDATPTCQPAKTRSSTPSLALPAGTIDSHCHIFGPHARFPYAPGRVFTPPDAPREQLEAVHDALGVSRVVLVQSAAHGIDHAAIFAALASRPERYRAVAILPADADANLVAALDDQQFCGARFHLAAHMGEPPDTAQIRRHIDLIRVHGWHAELHVMGHDLINNLALIRSIDSTVVIDHMGRLDLGLGLDSPQVEALCGLLDQGNVWVKLSGPERLSALPAPYTDAVALGRLLAAHNPDRVVWGTDYPHPNIVGDMVDDGLLVDLIAEYVPDETRRHRLLVDNPAALFGFPA